MFSMHRYDGLVVQDHTGLSSKADRMILPFLAAGKDAEALCSTFLTCRCSKFSSPRRPCSTLSACCSLCVTSNVSLTHYRCIVDPKLISIYAELLRAQPNLSLSSRTARSRAAASMWHLKTKSRTSFLCSPELQSAYYKMPLTLAQLPVTARLAN